ncbi:MAG: hypothetical protein VKP62_04520 [Candidatus Sericytochromatia bacterium]|nr:hypothetical protein [Candidatus Sericytochromatia bacterium]
MKLPLSIALSLSLLLAGCGTPAQPGALSRAAQAPVVLSQQTPLRLDAEMLASRLQLAGWTRVSVMGQVVNAQIPDDRPAVFDLSATARTGEVVFRSEGVSLSLPVAQTPGLTDDVAGILIALTARMLLGGAQAFVTYWLAHRGEAFNRKECAAAVVSAMVLAATGLVPKVGPLLAQLLAPIVRKWVERWISRPRPASLTGFLLAGTATAPEVAAALNQAVTETGSLARLRQLAR